MIVPLMIRHKPINRSQKRKVNFEMDKNMKRIAELESLFFQDLFVDIPVDYKFLYDAYLERWHKLIEFMKNNNDFKYTLPNEDYFAKMYFPEETDKGIHGIMIALKKRLNRK